MKREAIVPTPQTDPRWLLTRRELAAVFQVNAYTVNRWQVEEPPLPVAHAGGPAKATRFDLRHVIAWRVQRESRRLGGTNGHVMSKEIEQAHLAKATRERIELDIKRRRGLLFDSRIALEAWTAMVAAFRARALAIPRAVSESVVQAAAEGPTAVEVMLESAVNDALSALAGWEPPAHSAEYRASDDQT
jgi:phage terminase Nu1 subunit (DNA packaging protein)